MGVGAKVYPTAIISPRTDLEMLENCFIGDFCLISCRSLRMEAGSQVNAHTSITGDGAVLIGKDAVVSYGCLLMTATDTPEGRFMNDAKEEERKVRRGNINIGDRVFVGAHSIIMPGVSIGSGAVVGAGSYIDKHVPSETVVIPEQKLKMNPRLKYLI